MIPQSGRNESVLLSLSSGCNPSADVVARWVGRFVDGVFHSSSGAINTNMLSNGFFRALVYVP